MKKILLSLTTALSLAASAQADLEVTTVLPQAGYEFNTTDTVTIAFGVTNIGSTTIPTEDTLYYRLSIGNIVIPLAAGGTASTFYPAVREDDASNPAIQSELAPDSLSIHGLRLFPFSQANIDQFENNDVCIDILLWDGSEGVFESNIVNTGCNQITEPVGLDEKAVEAFNTYPNPVINEFNIELKEDKAVLTILDMAGRKLLSSNITEGVNTIDVSSLANGTYVYSVDQGKKYLGSGKIQK